jgi:hypothetical protein
VIHVVERPAQGDPHAWFAFDEEDFARKVYAADARPSFEIFDVVTPRELLDLSGRTPGSADARTEFPSICALGDTHGWDTPLYRADDLLGPGAFQPEAIIESQACLAALRKRDPNCLVFWNDDEALAAFERDPNFTGRANWRAAYALHQQLVALELLADNL